MAESSQRKRTRLRLIISAVLVIVVVIITAVFIVLEQFNQDPIPLGEPSGELAFMSDRDGDWNIYLLDAEGNVTNLTAEGGENGDADYFPSWAFNSDMINFLTNRDGPMGAGQVRPDGAELGTLSVAEAIINTIQTGRFDWDPSWSEGGETVLWASLRDFNLEVYTMVGNDTETMNRLTSDGLNGPRDWFMTWSPDGTRIAFSSNRDNANDGDPDDDDEEIYVMDADGSNVVQLTDSPGDDTRPAWSEDGTQILFVTERNVRLESGDLEMFIMNADGSDQRPLDEGEVFTGWLNYSADGTEVLYMSNEDGDWDIYVRDADGENVRLLTDNDSDDLFPVWRPTRADEFADDAVEATQEADEDNGE
jgi:Tol biopolymer transport system component